MGTADYWWESDPSEKYWCEVTGRDDIGWDLKAPQTDDDGSDYWSYSLIREVQPGDVVFHYSTTNKCFAGCSVAGGPLEKRNLVWVARGTSARQKSRKAVAREGWWRPLYGYTPSIDPLTLKDVNEEHEAKWLRSWIEEKRKFGSPMVPFQIRRDGVRAGQGYLFKMPRDFIDHWPKLSADVKAVGVIEQQLESTAESQPRTVERESANQTFAFKDESDYVAHVSEHVQTRSRSHEALVRVAASYFRAKGAEVSTPHPIDLLVSSPCKLLIEAKTTVGCGPLFAIRQAIGQLFEYRYFLGKAGFALCILLDCEPDKELIRFVETELGLYLAWVDGDGVFGVGLSSDSPSLFQSPRRTSAG